MLRRTSANYDANTEPAARRSVSSSKSNPEEIEFSPLTSRGRDLTSRDRARGSRIQLLVVYERASRAETNTRGKGHTEDTQMKTTKRSDPSLRPLNSHYLHSCQIILRFGCRVLATERRCPVVLSFFTCATHAHRKCSCIDYCVILFWLT